jgi:hypothetical protein
MGEKILDTLIEHYFLWPSAADRTEIFIQGRDLASDPDIGNSPPTLPRQISRNSILGSAAAPIHFDSDLDPSFRFDTDLELTFT